MKFKLVEEYLFEDNEEIQSENTEFTYDIPTFNKEKFEKTMASLQRKGLKVDYKFVGKVTREVTDKKFRKRQYICYRYIVKDEDLVSQEGWEFIGTIEHKESGNIIRKAVDVEVPEKYYSAPNECEHCHTIRNRNDTYLVRHIEDNVFKQVGKNCLMQYTGLNPAMCTAIMTLDSYLSELENKNDGDNFDSTWGSLGSLGYDSTAIKKIALKEIQDNGYKKASEYSGPTTKDKVIDAYEDSYSPKASDEEVNAMDEWVNSLNINSSDYYRNSIPAYKSEYYEYRDLGLVISLVYCYVRDLQYQKEKKARELQRQQAQANLQSDYLGEVGDKVSFEVATDNIIFVNEPYAYNGDPTYVHRIIDTNGYVIIWSTTNTGWNIGAETKEFPQGTKIKATIKQQKEYRGESQTVVTRGKIER